MTAVTQGAIDGLAGFIVEAIILVVAFIAADISLDVDTSDAPWGLILGIILLAVVGTVVAIFRIQRLHDAVVPRVRDAWGSLSGVLASPKRLFGMLGANLASRVILAIVLWFILQAIGAPLPLVTCLVVTVATNLLSGVVPVPGGIGVAEAAMTAFLGLGDLIQTLRLPRRWSSGWPPSTSLPVRGTSQPNGCKLANTSRKTKGTRCPGKAGGDAILSVRAELPIVSQDYLDHFTLIRYPSADAYARLLETDEWQEAIPFRVNALERSLAVPGAPQILPR